MNLTETDKLLTLMSNLDNRKVDDATVLAWHEVIGDLDFADAMQAVRLWRTRTREWIMPSDVRELVAEIDHARRRAAREAAERELAAIEAADPSRRDRSAGVAAIVAQVRQRLPEGDRDALRHGHGYWEGVRKDRERQDNASPNPHYDPAALRHLLAERNQE